MDFDSLKVSAKINSRSFENRSNEQQYTRVNKPSVDTKGSVSGGTNNSSISAASNTANNNNANNNFANNDDNGQGSANKEYISKLSSAINIANQSLKFFMIRKEFSYRVHEATNRVIVDVKNSETGEVIREIPSEEELDMIAKIRDLAGIFIDEKR